MSKRYRHTSIDYDHFHREGSGGSIECGIFPSVLRLLLVADFTDFVLLAALKAVETELKKAVIDLLGDNADPKQDRRSESRLLRPGATPPSKDRLVRLFEEVIRSFLLRRKKRSS